MTEIKRVPDKDYVKHIVITLGLAVAVVLVQRKAMKPDFARTVGMTVALNVKRAAQAQADFWQNLALKAGSTYNSMR